MSQRAELNIAEILLELERRDLLPAIVFRTGRAQCDADVIRGSGNRRLHLDKARQNELRSAVRNIAARYEMDEELIMGHPQYHGLIATAMGAHHAGQLLMWRLLLEELMAAGKLRLLIATGTVAAGVDFPARTVVITAHSKRGAEGYNQLTSAEFQQMSGRAGRRGKDAVGYCVAVPSRFCDARALLDISKRPAEPLVSSYYPSASTVLNLLRYRNVDDLRYTVDRSLAAFMDRKSAENERALAKDLEQEYQERFGSAEQDSEESSNTRKRMKKRIRRLMRKADELEGQQLAVLNQTLDGLERLNFVEDLKLSPKGYWSANLCTGMVLELAECIERGLFDGITAERLTAAIALLCAEDYRQYLHGDPVLLNKDDVKDFQSVVDEIAKCNIPGCRSERTLSLDGAFTALTWLSTEDWSSFRGLLALAGASEGDAARLLNQTAEHLNQLARLSETHQQLAFKAEEGRRRILRPPLSEAIALD